MAHQYCRTWSDTLSPVSLFNFAGSAEMVALPLQPFETICVIQKNPDSYETASTGPTERLSRDLLGSGGFAALISLDIPGHDLLTDDERRASLAALMAERPDGDVWIFAYGSLIWNPVFKSVEQRAARIDGWRRSFCFTTLSGRGSPESPGLVLGLDQGGSCSGVALRIAEDTLLSELELIWRREMATPSYVPRWMPLYDENNVPFGHGIAFTMDPLGPFYAGNLSHEEVVRRLAFASGRIGSSSEYLFRTHDGLKALGIVDGFLEQLVSEVRELQVRGP